MLAARDQENLTYAHQQAAAAKPLNHAPKTPGPNGTRGVLNSRLTNRNTSHDDENAPFIENTGGKKLRHGKQNPVAFQTPAPRDRLPLGAKTANAKTKALQTPAPATTAQKGLARQRQKTASARKSKLKIHHQSEENIALQSLAASNDESDDDSLPDIEFCPPKIHELPDYPDPEDPYEVKPEDDFSIFTKDNYFRNAWTTLKARDKTYSHDDGTTEELAPAVAHDSKLEIEDEFDEFERAGQNRQFSQIDSRSAAAALSSTKASSIGRFARPTAATRAKQSLIPAPKQRLTPGTAASYGTIGHAQGRKVSSTLKAANRSTLSSREREQRILNELCQRTETLDIFEGDAIKFDAIDDQWKDFQLDADKDYV